MSDVTPLPISFMRILNVPKETRTLMEMRDLNRRGLIYALSNEPQVHSLPFSIMNSCRASLE